jgi:hypothetical protein
MKTNVVMIRKMGQFNVEQRTRDGFFNATDLIKQWNKVSKNAKKDLSRFWDMDGVKEFIKTLMEEENLHTPAEVYVKSKASRGKNTGTWVHPILYIKLAMWLNPKFEYFVIRFVYDQLIEFRNSAGDNYKGLTASVQKFKDVDYVTMAKGLNYIIFNRHENGIRQTANQTELKELTELQKKLAFSIDMGFIKSFAELREAMLKIYYSKYNTL